MLDPVATVDLLDRFARIERLAAAGAALVATQVEAGGLWRGTGARDAVGYVAARTAQPRARVRDALGVAAAMGEMPQVAAGMRGGSLTVGQAADIAAAVAEHPDREAELVGLAGQVSPRRLKARCVEILAEGRGAEEQHRRARAERTCSSGVGRDGVWRQTAALPVIDGAFVDEVLDRFQTQIFDEARRSGAQDPYEAYRADALVAMARAAAGEASSTGASSLRHTIVVTVPHAALFGGEAAEGETCSVPGVGPVPVSVVQDLIVHGDPVVKAVVTRGREVTACTTLTRTVKEDLRLAVLVANDMTCAVPSCDNRRFLELDHRQPFASGGPTSYDNLRPLCSHHHDQRTRHGFELRGGPGSYEWLDPDGTILAADRPPVAA